MRLLALTNFLPPLGYGYGEICADAMGALAARGHEVVALCAEGGEAVTSFPVRRGLGHVPAAWRRPVAGLRGEATSQRMVRAALAEGVEAAFVWNMRGVGKGSLRVLHDAGIPVVYMLADLWVIYERPGPPQTWPLWPRIDRVRAYRALRDLPRSRRVELRMPPIAEEGRVVFASGWLRDRYAALGWRPRHGTVVPNGILLERFAATPRKRPAGAPLEVLYAGRLDPGKGADLAVAAARTLPHIRLTLAGTGEPGVRERLEAAAGQNVRFLGLLSRDEVAALMRETHVFLMPGRVEEAFGLVYLEAMAAGAAVVGTARGGAAELCRDGEDALVTAPEAGAVADALSRLEGDEGLRLRLASAGASVAARYSLDAMADRLQDQLASAAS